MLLGAEHCLRATVEKSDLRRVIRRARRLVPALSEATFRHQAVWLSASGDELVAEAGSATETIAQRIPCAASSSGNGIAAVPILVLSRVVSLLPDGPVEIKASNDRVAISAGSFATEFPALSSDEASAPLPAAQNGRTMAVPASSLSEGFNHLALALGHRQAWSPMLAAVELTELDGALRFAATDLQHLGLVEIPVAGVSAAHDRSRRSLLLPSSALDGIALLLPATALIDMHIGDDQADFVADGLAIRCRLQHDPYPNYAEILDTRTSGRMVLSRTRLAAAVERVAVLAERSERAAVWLQVDTDEVRIRAADREIGEAIETRRATITGGPCELGLYLWGFLAMVRRMRGNQLVLEFGERDKPITLSTEEHPTFRYFVMPLAIDPPPHRVAR